MQRGRWHDTVTVHGAYAHVDIPSTVGVCTVAWCRTDRGISVGLFRSPGVRILSAMNANFHHHGMPGDLVPQFKEAMWTTLYTGGAASALQACVRVRACVAAQVSVSVRAPHAQGVSDGPTCFSVRSEVACHALLR